jgi:hypothetical protein
VAVLLYIAGASYIFHYYQSFGIKPGDLNLSLYDALLSSLTVIFAWGWWALGIIVGAIIFLSVIPNLRVSQRLLVGPWGRALAMGLLLCGYVVLCFIAMQQGEVLAVRNAAEDMHASTTHLPRVDLSFKDEEKHRQKASSVSLTLEYRFEGSDYHLITHSNGRYFLLIPIRDKPVREKDKPSPQRGNEATSPSEPRDIQVYIVLDSEVTSLRLLTPAYS